MLHKRVDAGELITSIVKLHRANSEIRARRKRSVTGHADFGILEHAARHLYARELMMALGRSARERLTYRRTKVA